MKCRILWLYHDLLDLYGDCGNLMAVKKRICDCGDECEIVRASLSDELCFTGFDMIYCGSGRFSYLCAAADHFVKYRNEFLAAVQGGTLSLFTGNSMLLLGGTVTDLDRTIHHGVGLIKLDGEDTGEVYVSDVVSQCLLTDEKCYGFINTTARVTAVDAPPMFTLLTGAPPVSDRVKTEGIHINNLFSTWQQGPLLAKNPGILREFVHIITGENPVYNDELERTALGLTLTDMGF